MAERHGGADVVMEGKTDQKPIAVSATSLAQDIADEVMNGDRCYGCMALFETRGDGHIRTCVACDAYH